ncbi:alpha/beta fold hydrolase [Azohydromonas sediminis]|uniref:alpha/beta fold hydrolase n=1 Tax=Azohydromonas sediminis TaxID=2259674 RepID=UPI001F15E819|nr:alpha/beta fold hydrolase [Azohydromonas sediminis]
MSTVTAASDPSAPLAIAPRRWRLPVGDGHELQVYEWGEPTARPALVLHGGPGSGCSPTLVRAFDLRAWRVIGVDQRGAGLSSPAGATAHNTTVHLLADLRALRRALGVARWVVVGGSWGATLALAHALDEPDAVAALVLRGLFLARRDNIDAFFAAAVRDGEPTWRRWQTAADAASVRLVEHLAARLDHGDEAEQRSIVTAWWRWEQSLQGAAAATTLPACEALRQRYRVQAHYLRHDCWLAAPPLVERLHALPPVPTHLLHGARDRVCPPEGARLAHGRIAGSMLEIVEGAGHDPTHPAMAAAMAKALAGLTSAAQCGAAR